MALFVSGCVTIYNPATQRRESLFLNTSQEVSLGRDLDRQISSKYKILYDPQRQARLDAIGSRVAMASDRTDIAYVFRIVEDKELNAFATPGGFVYLHSGLMDVANDNELACVLAHEIGHIAARHSVKQMQTSLGYQLVLGIALGVSGSQDIGNAMNVVFNVTNLGYSRKDEYLADYLAVKYALRAGYDPIGMVTFFQKLKREEQARGGGARIVFLSSHPPIEERIKRVQEQIHGTSPLPGKPQ
jgi:predicted Zn-dependent protease